MKSKLLLLVLFSTNASFGTTFSVNWSGTISELREDATNALPAGLSVGDAISGTFSYSISDSYTNTNILGSHTYGDIYRFPSGPVKHVETNGYTWEISGGEVSFIGYSFEDKETLSIESTSDDHAYLTFPNVKENYRIDFYAWDDSSPAQLFERRDIFDPGFDFTSVTSSAGAIRTYTFDEFGDVSDGYDIEFNIAAMSFSSVPEPSKYSLFVGILSGILLLLRRRQIKTK